MASQIITAVFLLFIGLGALVEGAGRIKCVNGKPDASELKPEFANCLKFFDKNDGMAAQCVRKHCGGFDKCVTFFKNEVLPDYQAMIDSTATACKAKNKACKQNADDKKGATCKGLATCVKTNIAAICKV